MVVANGLKFAQVYLNKLPHSFKLFQLCSSNVRLRKISKWSKFAVSIPSLKTFSLFPPILLLFYDFKKGTIYHHLLFNHFL